MGRDDHDAVPGGDEAVEIGSLVLSELHIGHEMGPAASRHEHEVDEVPSARSKDGPCGDVDLGVACVRPQHLAQV